ncbi:MAG: metallophosphatase family protein [Chloroflexota bacterium]|nr:metallophosphatase family protein [Chloroflexota bacterium]
MKIAFFTDVHANLPALSAALDAIGREGVDAVYHLGDAVGVGPHPAECLDLLLATPRLHCVMGNHDAWFAHGLPDPRPPWMSEGEAAHHRWVHAQLDPELRRMVAAWPWAIDTSIGGAAIPFAHYALAGPAGGFAEIVRNPTPEDLDRLFPSAAGEVVAFGHHHPACELHGCKHYVNSGSLGCAPAAVARYAVLEATTAGHRLERRAVPYDDAELFQDFDRWGVPERDFLRAVMLGGRARWPSWACERRVS